MGDRGIPEQPLPLAVRERRLVAAVRRTFSSLDTYNYRLFFTGDLISHVGGWMQAMAEAWLVLKLTGSGAAVGAMFACRFGPILFFGMWGGVIADHFDRRRVLLITQSLASALAVVLWLIVFADVAQVWMLYALGFALGLVVVVDEPARQAFVEEMVGPEKVPNAVALNSAVMNSARVTGPALAGILIATVGIAWVFFVNAVSFMAVVLALAAMRKRELHRYHRPSKRPGVREGLAYAWSIKQIRSTILLLGVVGTLVYNFPTFLTLMAHDTFDGGAGLAGLLMAILGVGTIIGALAAALRANPTARTVIGTGALLGLALMAAAAMPSELTFMVTLVPVGVLAVFFGSTANGHMQIWSAPELRGRVMAIYSALTLGTTVIGGPFVGWVCQHWSPRAGLGLAGVSTFAAATILSLRVRVGASSRVVAPTVAPSTPALAPE
jgi:MFS family permease